MYNSGYTLALYLYLCISHYLDISSCGYPPSLTSLSVDIPLSCYLYNSLYPLWISLAVDPKLDISGSEAVCGSSPGQDINPVSEPLLPLVEQSGP